MIFAKLDVALQANPKAIKAGPAMYLWTYVMLWSRDQMESGFVPSDVVLGCAWGSRRANLRSLRVLEASGLFIPAEGGIRIWNYEKKNEVREVIKEKMARHRASQAKYASRPDVSAVVVSDAVLKVSADSDSDSDSVKTVSGKPVSSAREPLPDLSDFDQPEEPSGIHLTTDAKYMAAYVRGIVRGKRGPYMAPPGVFQQGQVNQAVQTFGRGRDGKALRGEVLLKWIEEAACDFSGDVARRGIAQFYSSYSPQGMVKWLNEQESAVEAKRVG